MARPIVPKPLGDHRLVLVRMQRSIEVDESIEQRQKRRLIQKLEDVVSELGEAVAESVKAS